MWWIQDYWNHDWTNDMMNVDRRRTTKKKPMKIKRLACKTRFYKQALNERKGDRIRIFKLQGATSIPVFPPPRTVVVLFQKTQGIYFKRWILFMMFWKLRRKKSIDFNCRQKLRNKSRWSDKANKRASHHSRVQQSNLLGSLKQPIAMRLCCTVSIIWGFFQSNYLANTGGWKLTL